MNKTVHVRVLISFDDVKRGDDALLELTPRVREWIRIGLVEVLGGEDPIGPGAAESDDHERVAKGTEGSVPTGSEPGEGFGTGAYGASEEFDKG